MLTIRPFSALSPKQQSDALALLFAHHSEDERNRRVEQARNLLEDGQLDPKTFLTSWINNSLIAVLVGEVLPGNSASIWPISSRPHPERIIAEDALFEKLIAMMIARRIKFQQTVLPADFDAAGAALLRNGFRRITRLWNMLCNLPATVPVVPSSLKMEAQTDAVAAPFQQALASSCNDGLDIPELIGLRTNEEIVAGHRADSPDLSRWWLARWNNEPAGVLLLADGAAPQLADLAYCGVAPAFRRRGVGRAILAFTLQKAKEMGANAIALLVDERNRPAIDLYKKFGFHIVDSREVYLRINS
jgi:GNAT superfamily N-acetyltransferase